jgi:hypothetical protein
MQAAPDAAGGKGAASSMSREQRRIDRRQQARGAAGPPSRRTPVRPASGGRQVPWTTIGVAGGALAIILLIAYLIVQSTTGSGDSLSASEKAEQDDSADLPGVFHPTQGRGHFSFSFSQDRDPTPFCEGVRSSENPEGTPGGTPAAGTPGAGTPAAGTPTGSTPAAGGAETTPDAASPPAPESTPTPGAAGTSTASGSTTPNATPTVPTNCYNSNPPTSGRHLGVQRNVDIGDGVRVNIPADPDVYPDDVIMPRESIPHILEHAGVFVGWNCEDGDQACMDVVQEVKDLVNDRIDNHNDRVAMARSNDLPPGEIGVASWTRVLNFRYQDYDEGAVEDFIGTHSCRFDPEGFCG